jgi:hypothetical protein
VCRANVEIGKVILAFPFGKPIFHGDMTAALMIDILGRDYEVDIYGRHGLLKFRDPHARSKDTYDGVDADFVIDYIFDDLHFGGYLKRKS